MKIPKLFFCVFVYSVLLKFCLGQNATGIYPFGSYQQLGFDTVNRGNGNVHFTIPIMVKSGRSGTDFNYSLIYDSLVWYPVSTPDGQNQIWTLVPGAGWSNSYGDNTYSWNVFGSLHYFKTIARCGVKPNVYTATEYDNVYYVDAYGIFHNTEPGASMDGCGGLNNISTLDGYTIYDNGQVSTPNNTVITPPINQAGAKTQQTSGVYALLTDPNGNEITEQNGSYTDTTGVNVLQVAGQGTNTSPITYTYPLLGGQATAQFTVTYVAYQVSTNFRCYNILDSAAQTVSLVDKITLPDGSFYSFTYEPNPSSGGVTGRLSSVTLPTGGTIQYSYGAGSLYSACTGINDDGSVGQLTRSASGTSSTIGWDTTQAAGQTLEITGSGSSFYNFVVLEGNDGSSAGQRLPYESGRTVYASYPPAGTPLLRSTTTYDGNVPVRTTSVTTSNNGGPLFGVTTDYDSLGDVTDSTVFDYGTSSSVGNAIQYKKFTYGLGNSLLTGSLMSPCSSCQISSSTTYNYDETTPTATSGLPQHVAVSGSRGNLTSIVQHVPSASDLTTTNQYDDAGSLQSSTSVLGTTSYTYDASDTNQTTITQPLLASGVQLVSSATYDRWTGLQTSSVDASGISATLQNADALLRPLNTVTSYGDLQQSSYPNPNTIQLTGSTHGSATVPSTITQLDGVGQVSSVITADDNASYRKDYTYDQFGRLTYASPSYTGNASSTKQTSGAGPTYHYDNLGRVDVISTADGRQTFNYNNQTTEVTDVNGLTKLIQSDALGRPVLICEVSLTTQADGTAPSACGNADFPNLSGFLTSYQYTVGPNAISTTTIVQGVQTRTFQTDALGRTVGTTEPERGSTTYSYTYNGTGLQVIRNRAKANQSDPTQRTNTTSQYDKYGRLLSVNYDDSLTPPKTFGYDFTSGSQYGLGRMAYISDTQRTSTGYIYDNAGRVSTNTQCLVGLCGQTNYDVSYQYSYYPDGLLKTESYDQIGFSGPTVTNSYAYSAAGYLTSLTQTTGTGTPVNIITGQTVVPGPNGITQYQTGNQATTQFSYDNLGRPTGAISCPAGTTVSGSLSCSGGSPIFGYTASYQGTRTTGINTTLQGTGTPGYDDLGRLNSMSYQVGNTTTAVQMSYDRYGNRYIPQNGQTPNPANNHDGLHSYDAAGNVTDNGAYTYDAEGNLFSSSDGMQRFYDCLNRLVYQYNNNYGYGRLYSYGLDDKRRGVFDGGATKLSDVIYANGQPVAYWDRFSNSYNYQYQNQVGTDSARENQGNKSTFSSLPFGDDAQSSGQDNDIYHYAGLDVGNATTTQWNQSTLEHAQFREYSPSNGHWFSPDPYAGSYNLLDPQSLNRFTYTLNNPVSVQDPSGLFSLPPQTLKNEVDDYKGDSARDETSGGAPVKPGGGGGHFKQAQNSPTPCRTGFNIGATIGADGGAGLGFNPPQIGAMISGAAGFTFGGTHPFGVFASGSAGAAAGSRGAPAQGRNFAAYLGGAAVGVGFTFGNATSAGQMHGDALTFGGGVDVGLGAGVQVTLGTDAAGHLIWQVSLTGGPGAKVYAYALKTHTIAASTNKGC